LKEGYVVPLHTRVIRRLLRPIFRLLFHILSRVRVHGFENVPEHGPYLIAINHISLYEPPFILAFWPTPIEAAGAVEIWQKQGQNVLVRLYGGIPVHRGVYDRSLIETMLAVLRSGRPLLIAPEGGRSHQLGMRQALPGVAYVIDQAEVPVIPVGIVGATDDFLEKALHCKRPTIEMRIGQAIHLPAITGKGEQRRLARQRNTDIIMHRIAALLPPEYRGVYANLEPGAQTCQ
jgi:1-acyl-sn-glycerol-3-phosphate acyltransferase